jgi:hypothetical protein
LRSPSIVFHPLPVHWQTPSGPTPYTFEAEPTEIRESVPGTGVQLSPSRRKILPAEFTPHTASAAADTHEISPETEVQPPLSFHR